GVADDPGMHSSQNEQDSRYYADFARIICLEPANQQEAYDMTREAFDLSERFHIPVMVRLVTRLAHSRAVVRTGEATGERPRAKCSRFGGWLLLPAMARKNFAALVEKQPALQSYTESCPHNVLTLNRDNNEIGVVTSGIARNYYLENIDELENAPSHLHVGAYPAPAEKFKALAAHVKKIIFLEEGYPFLEKYFTGFGGSPIEVVGKLNGKVPVTGELNPDNIRPALGLPLRKGFTLDGFVVPDRPPQFCRGCPHADTFTVIKEVIDELDESTVTSDIGCYALGALPPFRVPETIVDMGASVSMAKGAAEAGAPNVIAVIGDSTFLHSGITPLMDAVAGDVDMTVIIVDNETVAMTGGQKTLFPSSKLSKLVEGIGVDPKHLFTINAHRKYTEENKEVLRAELAHRGLSVIISVRECVETAKRTARRKERS
ncbi:MAG: indolepyruvate ferredoxin oxidoreductase, partial [Spirochaetales bacterium]|nr:indolepyruvate ferredoxin oxidoreductase [Spirochaetales bacterium]